MNRWLLKALGILTLAMLASAPALAADTVYYYYTDTLHSAAVITDAAGNVVERTYYAPYGQVLNRPLRDGPAYTGQYEDPMTGLDYMQQRYYDPQSGRFVSTDPVGVSADGGNFNRYWYANDNPYRYTDPNGRCAEYYSKAQGGGCKVDLAPSLAHNKQAQAAQKTVEQTLNKYDKTINALSNSARYTVTTQNGRHKLEVLGVLTGKQIKSLWNGQHFEIVPNGTYGPSNGGVGASVPGHTALEPQGVLGYKEENAVTTEVFHEFGHITPAGLQMTRLFGDAPIGSPEYIEREQKASTSGSVIAGAAGASFSCAAIAFGCY